MKIVVLAGGNSTEREVSIASGQGICKALRERNHRAIMIDPAERRWRKIYFRQNMT